MPLRSHQMCVPLNLKVTRYVRTFRPTIRKIIFSAHNENSNIAFAVGSWHVFWCKMWLKVWYWNKKFVVICPLLDNVFRIEKRLKSCSSLNKHRKFVIGLFVFYTVPTWQTLGIYCWKTKETTSKLHTSAFSMEIDYLTSLCELRVDDFKIWFVVLRFQKNTNQQTRRHYHFILRMRISQTLPNWKHDFGHCLSMNDFKMQRTVCNQYWTDISTASVIIRRMVHDGALVYRLSR